MFHSHYALTVQSLGDPKVHQIIKLSCFKRHLRHTFQSAIIIFQRVKQNSIKVIIIINIPLGLLKTTATLIRCTLSKLYFNLTKIIFF